MRAALPLLLALAAPAHAQEAPLYEYREGEATRWASPENPSAAKGQGAQANRGAKGHPFEMLEPGKALVLADIEGAGVIDRIWLTIQDRSPEMLRALRFEIFWDGARTPAVQVPLGDFCGGGAGALVAMDTALIASPEGRSCTSYIPMPFARGARLVVTNESAKPLPALYYDIDYRALARPQKNALYFHAWWSRDRATRLGIPFQVLPRLEGRGRFLGMAVTVFANPAYGKSWWGEGEVKMYLDGDIANPTLAGTGTEDYIGTGWGQGAYVHRFQGSQVADEARGRWSFYRYHIPDPVWFARNLSVELQQIGGAMKADVLKLMASGVPLQPVTLGPFDGTPLVKLLEGEGRPLTDPALPDGWANFHRSDDVSALALFYLDRPENRLPALAPVAARTAALRPPPQP
jgi:hypothetical protein